MLSNTELRASTCDARPYLFGVDVLAGHVEEAIGSLKHLPPPPVLGEIAAGQQALIAGQARRFAETRNVGAVHARPMDAGRRLAGEKQALANRRGERFNIVRRRADSDVAVRALRKRVAVPTPVTWTLRGRGTAVPNTSVNTRMAHVDTASFDHCSIVATLITANQHHQNRFSVRLPHVDDRRRRLANVGRQVAENVLVRGPESALEREDDLGQRPHAETGDRLLLPLRQRRIELDGAALQHAERQRDDDRVGLESGCVGRYSDAFVRMLDLADDRAAADVQTLR